MSQENNKEADEMRGEYDISGGERGKYYDQYQAGTNVVLLEPDVAAVFRDSETVNRTLRMLIDVARSNAGEDAVDRRKERFDRPAQMVPRNAVSPSWQDTAVHMTHRSRP